MDLPFGGLESSLYQTSTLPHYIDSQLSFAQIQEFVLIVEALPSGWATAALRMASGLSETRVADKTVVSAVLPVSNCQMDVP
jgi:hypothetical protein